MFKPVDRESAKVPIQQAKMIKHALGEALVEAFRVLNNDVPVFLRAFQHFPEFRAVAHFVPVGHVCLSLVFYRRLHR